MVFEFAFSEQCNYKLPAAAAAAAAAAGVDVPW